MDFSEVTARRRQEWVMKNIAQWREQSRKVMKLPASCWLLSKRAAGPEPPEGFDPREVAHTWAASTCAMVFLMCRWSQYLKGVLRDSAELMLKTFMSHWFCDVTVAFVFNKTAKDSDLPVQSHSLQHIAEHSYSSLQVIHGTVRRQDVAALLPRGSWVFETVLL